MKTYYLPQSLPRTTTGQLPCTTTEQDHLTKALPDSKIYGANMGSIWGRQDPGGPHDGPMNFAIWAPVAITWAIRPNRGLQNLHSKRMLALRPGDWNNLQPGKNNFEAQRRQVIRILALSEFSHIVFTVMTMAVAVAFYSINFPRSLIVSVCFWYVIIRSVKCGTKSFKHSPASTAISAHTLYRMLLPIPYNTLWLGIVIIHPCWDLS